MTGAFGSIDGVNLPVQTSGLDPELENATYNGWLHAHRVSSVLVFAPDGKVYKHMYTLFIKFTINRYHSRMPTQRSRIVA